MKIHKEGWGTILSVWGVLLVIAILSILFIDLLFLLIPILLICAIFSIFVMAFFREPKRCLIEGENLAMAVADGDIVVIDQVYEPEYFKSDVIQVSIYMDFFNMHINFWPISGEVTYYKYHPGKYMLAFMPKASELNEHTSVAVRGEYGDVFFKQIAGTFARRIVSYAKVGNTVNKCTQCGLIKFGSRIDMYFPLGTDIQVELGDKVRASETLIAVLKGPSKNSPSLKNKNINVDK